MSDMARYIDADKVMEEIASMGGHNLCEWSTLGVKALIDRQPTADVAPRAEVNEAYWEGVEYGNKDCAALVARKIFEEIEEYAELQIESLNIVENVDLSCAAFFGGGKQAFVLLLDRLAELKKKYTEEKK